MNTGPEPRGTVWTVSAICGRFIINCMDAQTNMHDLKKGVRAARNIGRSKVKAKNEAAEALFLLSPFHDSEAEAMPACRKHLTSFFLVAFLAKAQIPHLA